MKLSFVSSTFLWQVLALVPAGAQWSPQLDVGATIGSRHASPRDPLTGEDMWHGSRGARADLWLFRSRQGTLGLTGRLDGYTIRSRECALDCPPYLTDFVGPAFALVRTDVRALTFGPAWQLPLGSRLAVDAALLGGWLSRERDKVYIGTDTTRVGERQSAPFFAADFGVSVRWNAFLLGGSYQVGRAFYSEPTHMSAGAQRIAARAELRIPLSSRTRRQ